MEHWHAPWAVHPDMLQAILRAPNMTAGEIKAEFGIETTDTEATTKGAVAVIPLRGLITPRPSLLSLLLGGGGGLVGLKADLQTALDDDDVGRILLDIDSPGGSVSLLTETAAAIRAAGRRKPVTAIANTTAASAAYWLGSQASEFVVTPSGMVGSIGVLALHEDMTGMADKMGIKATLITAGKHKAEGHPLEPLSTDAKEAAQGIIDDHYQAFLADVAKGRGVTGPQVRDGFGEGRMVTAKKAVELGMADRVDSFDRTVARLASAGSDAQIAAEEHELQPSAEAAQPEDKPAPKGISEEDRARIDRLVTAKPRHLARG